MHLQCRDRTQLGMLRNSIITDCTVQLWSRHPCNNTVSFQIRESLYANTVRTALCLIGTLDHHHEGVGRTETVTSLHIHECNAREQLPAAYTPSHSISSTAWPIDSRSARYDCLLSENGSKNKIRCLSFPPFFFTSRPCQQLSFHLSSRNGGSGQPPNTNTTTLVM